LNARCTSATASDFRSSRDRILKELAKRLLAAPMMTSVIAIARMSSNNENPDWFLGDCVCIVPGFLISFIGRRQKRLELKLIYGKPEQLSNAATL
jgi:hypothetical protein